MRRVLDENNIRAIAREMFTHEYKRFSDCLQPLKNIGGDRSIYSYMMSAIYNGVYSPKTNYPLEHIVDSLKFLKDIPDYKSFMDNSSTKTIRTCGVALFNATNEIEELKKFGVINFNRWANICNEHGKNARLDGVRTSNADYNIRHNSPFPDCKPIIKKHRTDLKMGKIEPNVYVPQTRESKNIQALLFDYKTITQRINSILIDFGIISARERAKFFLKIEQGFYQTSMPLDLSSNTKLCNNEIPNLSFTEAKAQREKMLKASTELSNLYSVNPLAGKHEIAKACLTGGANARKICNAILQVSPEFLSLFEQMYISTNIATKPCN